MQFINSIHFRNWRGDLFGGLTAAIVSLPMALAFGVASGAGPEAGLYGAICVGLFASLFGGTPTLISEPTGPMTVVMTAIVTRFMADDPQNGMAMAFGVVILSGVFQILFGALRLGKYVTLMPYTVISGFMSGIGLILIVLQLAPFLGHASPGGVMKTLQELPQLVQTLSLPETILGVLTVALIFLTPSKYKKIVPPQLVALILGTAVSLMFFSGVEIRRIGEISAGLPTLQVPHYTWGQAETMVVDGLILGMLGCIDSLLTSTIADSLTRSQHNSDKELIGQGIGNAISGLFGGLPGAGATMGTVVNIQTGGRTILSGIVRAAILVVLTFWASGLTQYIPLAVLAGIALKVGIDIMDWGFLKRAHHVSWKAAAIAYGVMLLTVFVDLIVAVGIGVFVANVLTIQRMSELQAEDVRTITDADDEIAMNAEERRLMDAANGRVLLFHLSGPMIFGVAKAIAREHSAMEECEALIVDLTEVPHMGVTSALAIENAIDDAIDNGSRVYVVGATGQTARRLKRLGLLDRIPSENLILDRQEALTRAVTALEGNPPATPDDPSRNSLPGSGDRLAGVES